MTRTQFPLPDELVRARLVYLATPYTKYPAGIHQAFADAAELAARLLTLGVRIYSPIAHCHPLSLYGNLDPLDHATWIPFDEAMMAAAEILVVAHMLGWEESKGVAHEIDFFTRAGKPVFHLDPDFLQVTKR